MGVLLLLFVLLFSSCLGQTKKSLVVIHKKVRNVVEMKAALLRAYESHISKTDFVAFAVDSEIVLEWTSSDKDHEIRSAIANLPLEHSNTLECRKSETDYGKLLKVGFQHVSTELIIVVDNVRDSGDVKMNTQMAHTLASSGTKVYPIGVGKCIRDTELKRIAGPCNGFFGCIAPFSYFHASDYNVIHRKSEQEEKDTIETDNSLTTTEIVLTIVVSSLFGLLAIWCLVYTCCYLPKDIESDLHMSGIQSSVNVVPRPTVLFRHNIKSK